MPTVDTFTLPRLEPEELKRRAEAPKGHPFRFVLVSTIWSGWRDLTVVEVTGVAPVSGTVYYNSATGGPAYSEARNARFYATEAEPTVPTVEDLPEVLIVRPDGTHELRPYPGDDSLRVLQAAVDGYVQAVDVHPDVTAWWNEDGFGLELPVNDVGARLMVHLGLLTLSQVYVGSVAFTGGTDSAGDTLPLPQEHKARALAWLERQHTTTTTGGTQ